MLASSSPALGGPVDVRQEICETSTVAFPHPPCEKKLSVKTSVELSVTVSVSASVSNGMNGEGKNARAPR